MSRYLLVDGNNLLVRAVHAADRTGMGLDDGTRTGALLIFINMLARHVREERPTHILLCWDGGRSEYRTALYPDYKAHRGDRQSEPDERGPFSQAKEFCSLAGIHHAERPGWEADDLVACAWQRVRRERPEDDVVILSGDKDLLQLLDARTEQVRPVTPPNPTDRWDAARVQQHYKVPARWLSAAMALIGDPGDNVPGVRGIGPVKAAKMLHAAGGSLSTALAEHAERRVGLLSHALVDLREMRYDKHGLFLPLPPAFSPTTFGGVYGADLIRYLERYRLESVRARLAAQTLWSEPPSTEEDHVRVPGAPL